MFTATERELMREIIKLEEVLKIVARGSKEVYDEGNGVSEYVEMTRDELCDLAKRTLGR